MVYLALDSGTARLTSAVKMPPKGPPDRKVLIATKADTCQSNTKYAQGGVSTVMDFGKNPFYNHILDT